jgi:hypothetical protein
MREGDWDVAALQDYRAMIKPEVVVAGAKPGAKSAPVSR